MHWPEPWVAELPFSEHSTCLFPQTTSNLLAHVLQSVTLRTDVLAGSIFVVLQTGVLPWPRSLTVRVIYIYDVHACVCLRFVRWTAAASVPRYNQPFSYAIKTTAWLLVCPPPVFSDVGFCRWSHLVDVFTVFFSVFWECDRIVAFLTWKPLQWLFVSMFPELVKLIKW